VASALLGQRSYLYAFTHTVTPEPWLLDEVDSAIEAFGERFGDLCPVGLDALENVNLDTGRVEDPDGPYALTVETAKSLAAQR